MRLDRPKLVAFGLTLFVLAFLGALVALAALFLLSLGFLVAWLFGYAPTLLRAVQADFLLVLFSPFLLLLIVLLADFLRDIYREMLRIGSGKPW